jgi:hypothetical protein
MHQHNLGAARSDGAEDIDGPRTLRRHQEDAAVLAVEHHRGDAGVGCGQGQHLRSAQGGGRSAHGGLQLWEAAVQPRMAAVGQLVQLSAHRAARQVTAAGLSTTGVVMSACTMMYNDPEASAMEKDPEASVTSQECTFGSVGPGHQQQRTSMPGLSHQ